MITHDETKKAHARLFDSYISGHFAPFPTRSDLDTIRAYIAQQEKKDELLNLYRNLSMETDVIERSKCWERINKIELEELK